MTKLKMYLRQRFSALRKYRLRLVFVITLFWMFLILIGYSRDLIFLHSRMVDSPYQVNTRFGVGFYISVQALMCFIMSWILVFRLKAAFRYLPLGLNIIMKSGLLLIAAFLLTFVFHTLYDSVIRHIGLQESIQRFYQRSMYSPWLLDQLFRWLGFFILTFLLIEINEKYSPGVFFSILLGRYIRPKSEDRLVIFVDLKDSTTIAERLGHEKYFQFIRNFIYYISSALLEYNAQIYQYVGDEVVASWRYDIKKPWYRFRQRDPRRPIKAILECRRKVQKHSQMFKRRYGLVPEFRVGIHCGKVSIGEIGVVKKDLAMSGDTMNTAARIRSACSTLDVHFLISEDYFLLSGLKSFQVEDMGTIELKGKEDGLKLYALRM